MEQKDKIIYWIAQRDMIADIFMWLRDSDEKTVIRNLASLYNSQFDGKNQPNPHVEHFMANKTK